MRTGVSALRLIFHALRTIGSDLRREFARLNNVAEGDASCSTSTAARARKVKEWMEERCGNSARCC